MPPYNDPANENTPPLSSAAHRRSVFFGPLGLRAGWGIVLFVILAATLSFAIGYVAVHVTGQQEALRLQQHKAEEAAREVKARHSVPSIQAIHLRLAFPTEIAQVSGPLIAAFLLAYLERRRFRAYGVSLVQTRDLLPGALWGLIAMSFLVGSLHSLHLLIFDGRLLPRLSILRYGLGWLLFFFLVGIGEEFLFRGYLQFTLMRGLLRVGRRTLPNYSRQAAFWISACIWSLLFSAVHLLNAGENPVGLLDVFAAGILFSYALWRTGSLWWGIGFHMTWDWSQSFLYGTPDSGTLSAGRLFQTHAAGPPLLSGGIDGPEGSVFGIIGFLIAFAALRLRPQAEQPSVEPD